MHAHYSEFHFEKDDILLRVELPKIEILAQYLILKKFMVDTNGFNTAYDYCEHLKAQNLIIEVDIDPNAMSYNNSHVVYTFQRKKYRGVEIEVVIESKKLEDDIREWQKQFL